MQNYLRLLLLSFLVIPFYANADDISEEARAWFLTEFVPQWQDTNSADPGKMKEYWTDRFRDHPIDMDSSIWENTTETWQNNIQRNLEDGILGSRVIETRVEALNDFTVLIRAVWQDREVNGDSEELYCGIYLAGKFQGAWKFTNYFTVDCPIE